MNNEQMKADFEAEAVKHDMDLNRFEAGYSDCNTDYGWVFWQAATLKAVEAERERAAQGCKIERDTAIAMGCWAGVTVDPTPFDVCEARIRSGQCADLPLPVQPVQDGREKVRVIDGVIHTLEWTPQVMQPAVQPVQEPVGSVVRWLDGSLVHGWFGESPPEGTFLYTDPPQRPWVSLTEEERQEIWKGCDPTHAGYVTALVEAKLKEKNT